MGAHLEKYMLYISYNDIPVKEIPFPSKEMVELYIKLKQDSNPHLEYKIKEVINENSYH